MSDEASRDALYCFEKPAISDGCYESRTTINKPGTINIFIYHHPIIKTSNTMR